MRKIVIKFLIAVLTCLCGLCCVSCNRQGEVLKARVLEKNDELVVIQVEELNGDATLYDALVYLRDENALDFESAQSAYGQYLLRLNGKENPASGAYFWASYICNVSQGNPDMTYTYDGVTYYFANYGMDGVHVQEGGIYVWVYEESIW